MLALNHAKSKVFLYKPEAGLAVPISLDFDIGNIRIEIPPISDLHSDYEIFDDISQLVHAVGKEQQPQIDTLYRFSEMYSKIFDSVIQEGSISIASLRSMIVEHFRNNASIKSKNKLEIYLPKDSDELNIMNHSNSLAMVG